MTALLEALDRAEGEAARLRRLVASATCREVGCDMQSIGGRNAECERDCGCSIPVLQCTRCGDCDYGDNPEAAQVRADCERDR